ncbi:MAG: GTP-binding protein, partial [Lachnospiraceae bacterium]|nr:GTP-binding protein [Lachnospiraceae bacterium]
MTKIDIFSGFLGAGKTTLIKKLIAEAYKGEKLVLIENEFGDVGIDGGFLKDSGITINEMNSGCICCTLVGDFSKALEEVLEKYAPDRILIEPSGVGKLSDIIGAVSNVGDPDKVKINRFTAVVDAGKCKMYMKNFGEFFNNQIECAKTIILSRTQTTRQDKLDEAIELIRKHNAKAVIIATPWDDIDGSAILAAMEKTETFEEELLEEARKIAEEHRHEHEHHHHHDHD